MSDSIFSHTMVDMPYTEIEKAAKEGAVVLLPVSVVEEHGPHLCTGTDIYLTQTICDKINSRLSEMGVQSLIATPFYWGVNSMTNGFAGSFEIKPQTMILLLTEIMENFKKWGFRHIYLINFHGDFVHIKTIVEAVKAAYTNHGILAHFVNDVNLFARLGYINEEPFLTKVTLNPGTQMQTSDALEIHAGGFETSWMIHSYKELVNIPLAESLESSHTGMPELIQWSKGGETARKITPNGYFGDPSKIDLTAIETIEKQTVEIYSRAIASEVM